MDTDHSRLDKYLILKPLGHGASSKVKLATDSESGELVAIKIFKTNKASNLAIEVEMMQRLSHHPNTIKILHYSDSGEYFKPSALSPKTVSYAVLELAPRGEIFDYVYILGKFPEPIARFYYKQLLSALSSLHNLGYAHRDIKPENIFVAKDFSLKLGDFGFCGDLAGKDKSYLMSTFRGTRAYMAPEIHERKPYDGIKVDLFSAAIIGFILTTGRPPFMRAERTNPHYYHIVTKNWAGFWRTHESGGVRLNPLFKNLMEQMLAYEPSARLSIEAILQHPWMQLETSTLEEAQTWLNQPDKIPKLITLETETLQEDCRGSTNSYEILTFESHTSKQLESFNPKPFISTRFMTNLSPDWLWDSLKNFLKKEKCTITADPLRYVLVAQQGQDDERLKFRCELSRDSNMVICEYKKVRGDIWEFGRIYSRFLDCVECIE